MLSSPKRTPDPNSHADDAQARLHLAARSGRREKKSAMSVLRGSFHITGEGKSYAVQVCFEPVNIRCFDIHLNMLL